MCLLILQDEEGVALSDNDSIKYHERIIYV